MRIFVFLVVCCAATGALGCFKAAFGTKLINSGPITNLTITEGEPLTLMTCLYDKEVPNKARSEKFSVNSSNILIRKYGDDPKDFLQDVEIYNDTCVRWTKNETTAEDSGTYDYLVSLPNGEKLVYCFGTAKVEGYPRLPKNLSCKSTNLDSFTCNWDTLNNNVETTYSVQMLREFENRTITYNVSIEENLNSFTLYPKGNGFLYFPEDYQFKFRFTGKNKVGNRSKDYITNHYAYVQLSSPVHLTCVTESSSSIGVTWIQPTTQKNMASVIFQVNYTSECNFSKAEETDETEIKLRGLNPFTTYNISVRAKPREANDSLWSPFLSITCKTFASAPSNGPSVSKNGFEIFNSGPSRKVKIYYTKLPKCKWHDSSIMYSAFNCSQESPFPCSKTVTTGVSMLLTDLLPNKALDVKIFSNNSVGSSSPSYIRIPMTEKLLQPVKYAAVKKVQDGVKVKWRYNNTQFETSKHIKYTVFYCKGPKDECTEDVRWTTVPGNQSQATLKLSDPESYRFAVAVETDKLVSGLTWIECIPWSSDYKEFKGSMEKFEIESLSSTQLLVKFGTSCSALVRSRSLEYCHLDGESDSCEEQHKAYNCQSIFLCGFNETVTLSGLIPGSTYRITLKTIDDDDITRLMPSKCVTTMPSYKTKTIILVTCLSSLFGLVAISMYFGFAKLKSYYEKWKNMVIVQFLEDDFDNIEKSNIKKADSIRSNLFPIGRNDGGDPPDKNNKYERNMEDFSKRVGELSRLLEDTPDPVRNVDNFDSYDDSEGHSPGSLSTDPGTFDWCAGSGSRDLPPTETSDSPPPPYDGYTRFSHSAAATHLYPKHLASSAPYDLNAPAEEVKTSDKAPPYSSIGLAKSTQDVSNVLQSNATGNKIAYSKVASSGPADVQQRGYTLLGKSDPPGTNVQSNIPGKPFRSNVSCPPPKDPVDEKAEDAGGIITVPSANNDHPGLTQPHLIVRPSGGYIPHGLTVQYGSSGEKPNNQGSYIKMLSAPVRLLTKAYTKWKEPQNPAPAQGYSQVASKVPQPTPLRCDPELFRSKQIPYVIPPTRQNL